MTPRLSVVIPTWNRKGLLEECLTSLAHQFFRDFEIVVVNDGSTDGTEAMLKERYPEVRVVALPENRGFCRAINAGIREARGSLLFLLNNDMTLEPDCIERLALAAENSTAALFAPLVLWRDAPDTVYSAGDRIRRDGRPEAVAFRCPLLEFTAPDEVFGVSAGAGLYRKAVFNQIGLFDERFGAYFEDADLAFRARLAGFDVRFVREAVAYHVGSASIEGRTWWRARQCYRNHALLVMKNMPLRLAIRNGPVIIAERYHQMGRAFSAARTAFGAARAAGIVLAAWASIIRRLPYALRERRRIQASRRIDLKRLDAVLADTSPAKRSP
ncbi:MAG TPA: glycosyltransferase family 2 protein [Candidatus Hydrogenedentes bacterium]|nr:glycosyltransferase family 2 protein [Candidatus Hydrogenedentota bacterium]